MPPRFNKNHAGIYFLLGGLTAAVLPLLSHLPIWTAILCFVLLLWRLLHETKHIPLPGKFITPLMVIAIIAAVFYQYQTIIGRVPGSTLLLSLICLKLMELRSLRDVSMAVQLAFFAVLAGFLFDQSFLTALLMFIATVLLFCALLNFHHNKANYVSTIEVERSHILMTLKTMAYAIPLTLLLFTLFPRLNTSFWALPEDAIQADVGLSDEMSPGKVSQLSNSTKVAFRVQFDDKVPANDQRYWRGPVLWFFDGETWSSPERDNVQEPYVSLIKDKAEPLKYTITLEAHNKHWLFALDLPTDVPYDSRFTPDMQLLSTKPINKLTKYQLGSHLQYRLPLQSDLPMRPYLFVPDSTAPRARAFVQQLQTKHTSTQAIMQAILQEFKNNDFYYTRTPPRLLNDPVDEFLFDTKRGYCEHYASSFTVLMRLAGVPARVVTGYQGGEMNPLSNYMILRQSDAHAWSEVYFPDQGWVRIDPTTMIPLSHIEDPVDAVRRRPGLIDAAKYIDRDWLAKSMRQVRFAMDMLNNQWNQWIVGYNQQRQQSFLASLGLEKLDWYKLGYLLVACLLLVTAFIAWRIFASQHSNDQPAQRIYQRFLSRLARRKIYKRPSEGALSFAQRMARRFPAQRNELLEIAHLYNDLRYAHPGGTDLNLKLQSLKSTIRQLDLP